MTSKKTKNKTEWFENPWAKLISALTGAILLFGAGYSTGQYQRGIECDLEQIKVRQEFNEKLLNEISTCQSEKLVKYEGTVEELKTVIELLNKQTNGTKK